MEQNLQPISRFYLQLYGVYDLTIHIVGLRIQILSQRENKSILLNVVLSSLQLNCPICLQCLEDLIAAEVIVNKNRLKGTVKYDCHHVYLHKKGTCKDCHAAPVHVSIGE